MKNHYKQRLTLSCLVILSMVLTSCGGSQESSTTNSQPSTSMLSSGNTSSISLTGVVVDGYMWGATAFVDRNNNGALDDGEPRGVTGQDGKYTLTGLVEGDENFPVVVDIPVNAIDSDTKQVVNKHSVMTAPAPGLDQYGNINDGIVVSPITTMIKITMDSKNTDKKSAEADIRAKLGLTNKNIDLFADYVFAKSDTNKTQEDKDDFDKIHKIAQVVARSVADQVDAVELAAKQATINTGSTVTLADVIAMITNQVVTQLTTIDAAVTNKTGVWDAKVDGDDIVKKNIVKLVTTDATFKASVQNQIKLTQAATEKAKHAALAALAAAEVANLAAQQANTKAQAALNEIKLLLAQAKTDQAVKDQYANAAVKAQAVASAQVAKDTYTSSLAMATMLMSNASQDPYAAQKLATIKLANQDAADQQAAMLTAEKKAIADALALQNTFAAQQAQASVDFLAIQAAINLEKAKVASDPNALTIAQNQATTANQKQYLQLQTSISAEIDFSWFAAQQANDAYTQAANDVYTATTIAGIDPYVDADLQLWLAQAKQSSTWANDAYTSASQSSTLADTQSFAINADVYAQDTWFAANQVFSALISAQQKASLNLADLLGASFFDPYAGMIAFDPYAAGTPPAFDPYGGAMFFDPYAGM
ncbi:MAG: hypothetical protein R8M45_07215, partial [Ghiorsea sp.]